MGRIPPSTARAPAPTRLGKISYNKNWQRPIRRPFTAENNYLQGATTECVVSDSAWKPTQKALPFLLTKYPRYWQIAGRRLR